MRLEVRPEPARPLGKERGHPRNVPIERRDIEY
jgi:hypothetical protein